MSLYEDLEQARRGVAVPGPVRELLAALQSPPGAIPQVDQDGLHSGTVTPGRKTRLLGFFDLALTPEMPQIPYRWKLLPGGGFQLDLIMSGIDEVDNLLSFADPNNALHAARVESEPAVGAEPPKVWLTKTADPVHFDVDFAVRVAGTPNTTAAITWLKLEAGPQDDVFVLTPAPPLILLGDSGFGLDLTGGIVVDDSATASAPHASETPSWTGVAIRGAKLYVPRDLPLIGGRPIDFDLELGKPGGLHASVDVTLPGDETRPDIEVRLEWQDPAAVTLEDLLPTAIEATARFPVAGRHETAQDPFTLGGGDPVTVRLRCARGLPPTPSVSFELSVDAAGPDGLIKVTGSDTGGKVVVTAAALATALVADSTLTDPSPSGDESGIRMHELLTAATAASAFLDAAGAVVVDRIALSGTTAEDAKAVRLSVDYLVDVEVRTFNVGVVNIHMDDNHPMRIRYRNVIVEATGTDLTSVHLNFAEATLDVEDPGSWKVISPGSVLDVIGTRSGRGSLWYEIDLKFKLKLGPVTVSNATVRLTADGENLHAELRGLGVDIKTPALTGHGSANIAADGFSADLSAQLGPPIGIGARVYFVYGGGLSFAMEVIGALPGPIPLGPTGLGLYSLGGMFGINEHPVLPAGNPGDDMIQRQLNWDYKIPGDLADDPGAMMFGLSAGVGTLYDLGFTFNATGKLVLTIPDPTFRLAINAAVLRPPDFLHPENSPLKGLIVVDDDAITVGAHADFTIDHLVQVQIPLDAHLPFTDPTSWYFRLGSDGAPGRGPGPMTARILPELFGVDGSAYLMVQGDAINRLGNVDDPRIDLQGPAIGFGMAVDLKWGTAPVWLQLSARARAGMATNPWFLAGSGTITGALHLGPFSIGAHATLNLVVGPGPVLAADFRVCGSIDLWFTEIEGCVNLSIGGKPATVVPDPGPWPVPTVSLSDRHYVQVAEASVSPATAPTVWPDVVPILQFGLGPDTSGLHVQQPVGDPSDWTPFAGIDALQASGATGNDHLRYVHRLMKVQLWETDSDGAQTMLTDSLEAAWQQPKHAEGVGPATSLSPSGARELALLTHRSDMWAHRRNDGAAGAAPGVDPVRAAATGCHTLYLPPEGWAIGGLATAWDDGWQLPYEPGTPSESAPFTAHLTTSSWGEGVVAAEAAMAAQFPPPLFFKAAAVAQTAAADALGRQFTAGLTLPAVTSILDTEASSRLLPNDGRLVVSIVADRQVSDATLWLLVDRTYPDPVDALSVDDIESGNRWTPQVVKDIAGGLQTMVSYRAPADSTGARVAYPPLLAVTVLGLHGTTVAAIAAAAAATASAATTSQTIAEHNAAEPQFRTPLKLAADKLYKIVVGTQIAGTLADGTTALFPGDSPNEAVQEFWFRTAKLPAPGGDPRVADSGGPPVPQLRWHEFARTQETFQTDYLARYLSSYSPSDRTTNWYLADDLVANFDQDHVDQIAGLYGYRLDLHCVRTDTPPVSERNTNPWAVALEVSWKELVDIGVLDQLGRRYLTEASFAGACPVARAGASLGGSTTDLVARATYQLQIAFVPIDVTAPAVKAPPAEPLPGIIFSTSRYHDPAAQLSEMGFGYLVPGVPNGRLFVTGALPAATSQDSDLALANALDQLGLEGWPLPESGRTSVMWAAGTNRLVGVLVETPEPLDRPGRIEVSDLTVNGTGLGTRISDSAHCRYLFLAASPLEISVGTPVTLTLTYQDRGVSRSASCATSSPIASEVTV